MVVRNRKTKSKKTKLILPNAKEFIKTFLITLVFYISIMIVPVFFNSKWTLLVIYFIVSAIFIGGSIDKPIKRQLIFDKFLVSVFTFPLIFLAYVFFITKGTLNQAILSLVNSENYLFLTFSSALLIYTLFTLKTYNVHKGMDKENKL